ncbi:MAG: potassium transporter TrkA [Micrococcales bacterium]|nr:MAG: potassium transporter TrkA [Micrococcales bacterium]PIE27913.1 MAG: potassium transporter TrkA [Micrococcales bacterium]
MHFVVMGCGRVGSSLAHRLEDRGHTVAVVDRDSAAFRRLRPTFEGSTVVGVGFDREIMALAGIERAYAFAAVSSGDNSNILAARVARETFGLQHVVARIYDAQRAEVYQRLGIPTVATVSWATDQILRRLLPAGASTAWTDPTGQFQLAEIQVAATWVGVSVRNMQIKTGARVALVTRLGEGLIPVKDTVFQEGDRVHFIIATPDIPKVEKMLLNPPQEKS